MTTTNKTDNTNLGWIFALVRTQSHVKDWERKRHTKRKRVGKERVELCPNHCRNQNKLWNRTKLKCVWLDRHAHGQKLVERRAIFRMNERKRRKAHNAKTRHYCVCVRVCMEGVHLISPDQGMTRNGRRRGLIHWHTNKSFPTTANRGH